MLKHPINYEGLIDEQFNQCVLKIEPFYALMIIDLINNFYKKKITIMPGYVTILGLTVLIAAGRSLGTYSVSYRTDTVIDGSADSMAMHPYFPLGQLQAGTILSLNVRVPNYHSDFTRFRSFWHRLYQGTAIVPLTDFNNSLCLNSSDFSSQGCTYNHTIASTDLYYFRISDATFDQLAVINIEISMYDTSSSPFSFSSLLKTSQTNRVEPRNVFHLQQKSNVTLTLQPTIQAFSNRRKLQVNLMDQNVTNRPNIWTMDYADDLPFNITYDSTNRSLYQTQLIAGSYSIRTIFKDAVSNVTLTFQSDSYDCPFDSDHYNLFGDFLPCLNNFCNCEIPECTNAVVTEGSGIKTETLSTQAVTAGRCDAASSSTFAVQSQIPFSGGVCPVSASCNTTSNSTTSTNSSNLPTQSNLSTLTSASSEYEWQLQLTMRLKRSLERTLPVLGYVLMFALSNPYTYFILDFVNFFTLSSHYVIINQYIPEQLNAYLLKFYQQVNQNMVSRYFNHYFVSTVSEGVDRSKLLQLEMSTDLVKGQGANFTMAIMSIILFMGLSQVVRNIKGRSIIKRLLVQPFDKVLFGQYLSLILPLTCPWVFFFKGTFEEIGSLLNLSAQYILFCQNLVFILSLYSYIAQQKGSNSNSKPQQLPSSSVSQHYCHPRVDNLMLSHTVQKQGKQRQKATAKSLAKRENKAVKLKIDAKKLITQNPIRAVRKQSSSGSASKPNHTLKIFLFVLSPQEAEEWYAGFSNFIYPLVLVVAEPVIPLIVLSLYCFIGIRIALQQQKYKINRIILAIYPLLFHVCFIIFKIYSQLSQIVAWTQIACFVVLILGSLHHLCFITFRFGLLLYCYYRKTNRVSDNCKQAKHTQQGPRIQSRMNSKRVEEDSTKVKKKEAGSPNTTQAKLWPNMPMVDGFRLAVGRVKKITTQVETGGSKSKDNKRRQRHKLKTDRQGRKGNRDQIQIVNKVRKG